MYLDDKKRYDLEMEEWEVKMIKLGRTDLIRHNTLVSQTTPTRQIQSKQAKGRGSNKSDDSKSGTKSKETTSKSSSTQKHTKSEQEIECSYVVESALQCKDTDNTMNPMDSIKQSSNTVSNKNLENTCLKDEISSSIPPFKKKDLKSPQPLQHDLHPESPILSQKDSNKADKFEDEKSKGKADKGLIRKLKSFFKF